MKFSLQYVGFWTLLAGRTKNIKIFNFVYFFKTLNYSIQIVRKNINGNTEIDELDQRNICYNFETKHFEKNSTLADYS